MDIIFFAMKKWIQFYIMLYYYLTFPLLMVMIWFWLTHIDCIQLKLKFRDIGEKIQKNKFLTAKKDTLSNFFYKQINNLGEILVGFTDGLLNHQPTVSIKYVTNFNSQKSIDQYEIETQTNIVDKSENYIENHIDVNVQTEIENNDGDRNIDKEIVEEKNEKIPLKKIFIANHEKKPILDTELLERDAEEDINALKKPKRIYIRRK
jgi:hypothetical protein